MRALRVVGITGDGSVVLEDPGRRERYTVPADEQLRAAARGDVTRLGQIAIELESQLRPREIQARIRGGASVDQVAAAAGVPVQKIERFAYPVLLERSRTAELAQGAHPQRADGPDVRTLGETVAHTFGLRGQDYATAGWDSWKGEDGKWVVALSWSAGRSENAAHWAFQPGAHGGTVVPLDEHASDLVEGLPARPLRTVGPVIDIGRDDEPGPGQPHEPESPQMRAAAGGDTRHGIAPEQRRSSPPPAPRGTPSTAPATTRPPARGAEPGPAADEYAAPDPAAYGPAGSGDPASHTPAARDSAARDSAARDSAARDSAARDSAARDSAARDSAARDSAAQHESRARDSRPDGSQARALAHPSSPAESGSPADPAVDRTPAAGPGPDRSAARRPADRPGTRTEADRAPAVAAPGRSDQAPAGDRDDTSTVADGVDRDARVDAPDPAVPPSDTSPSNGDRPDDTADDQARTAGTGGGRGAANRRTKKGKPVMPSWDEVLLGVRGQR